MTWHVEPDEGAHAVRLRYETDGVQHYTTSLDASEAWDLGDDLIIAATDLLPWEPVGFTTQPPWLAGMGVIRWGAKNILGCTLCYADTDVTDMNLGEVNIAAREHWLSKHKEVTDEEPEGPDGRPDEAIRGGDEAAAAPAHVHDPAA